MNADAQTTLIDMITTKKTNHGFYRQIAYQGDNVGSDANIYDTAARALIASRKSFGDENYGPVRAVRYLDGKDGYWAGGRVMDRVANGASLVASITIQFPLYKWEA